MNFKDLLKLTEESRAASDSFRTTGEALKKDRAKSGASTDKAKDAARKRAERARQIPRERKSKAELVKDVIAVKTASGRVQLIFKDSFNKNSHTKLNKDDVMTEDEAKRFTSDPNFEQTRASKLLFGEVKTKEEGAPKEKKKAEEGRPEKKSSEKETEAEEKEETPKAKKLSKDDIMKAMLQMSPDQLVDMPEDIRQDFFDRLRSPISSKQFDSLTFENLTNKFGINALAGISHNQQVLNALLFVAKLKAGASDQEMQTLAAMAPETLDFSKTAFLQASKILSQIGDECIQNLISSMEAGNSGMYSEGMPDLECGDYKFKISAGGEFVISTNSLNQSGKIVKGLIGNALAQTIMDPNFTQNNPNVQEFLNDVETYGDNYSDKLLPDNSISAILSSPELMAKFQNYQVISPNGKSLGNAIDEDGNVNPAISLSSYEAAIKKSSKNLIKGGKNNEILRLMASNLLKTSLRGDGINKESSSPNHIITSNGIFKLTDDYIGEIAKTAKIDVKKNTQMIDNENISKINKSAAKNLGRWRAIIESNQPKFNIEKLFVNRKELQPIKVAVDGLMDEFSFDINTSLVPGFKPEEINAIEYNYVTIDGKTTKIPVTKSENSTPGVVSENYSVVNEIIYESLTNNFLLSELKKLNLLNSRDIQVIEKYGNSLLTEDDLRQGCLIPILNETYTKTKNNTDYLIFVLENIISNIMEAERNYKKEYRNYHGKPKQRKERAARTKARELMIKKGLVKKGDDYDIDHKKPLRSGGTNGINNLRKRKRSHNRSDNGHKKGEKQDKDWK